MKTNWERVVLRDHMLPIGDKNLFIFEFELNFRGFRRLFPTRNIWTEISLKTDLVHSKTNPN